MTLGFNKRESLSHPASRRLGTSPPNRARCTYLGEPRQKISQPTRPDYPTCGFSRGGRGNLVCWLYERVVGSWCGGRSILGLFARLSLGGLAIFVLFWMIIAILGRK